MDEIKEKAIGVLTNTGLFDHIANYTPEHIAGPLVNRILSLETPTYKLVVINKHTGEIICQS